MTNVTRLSALLLSACLLLSVLPCAQAETSNLAEDISGTELITDHVGFYGAHKLFDKNTIECKRIEGSSSLTLSHEAGIGSLYLIFDLECSNYTVTNNDTGESHIWGDKGFLHEFVDLEGTFGAAPKSVTLTFGENPMFLNEIYAFTSGEVPDFVQKWEVPRENETDLILFSTHGDDEQLFFAGILPYYAGELDYEVLVVYLTNHRNFTRERCHEMLNGLWAVGATTYPVFGGFPDFHIKDKAGAYSMFKQAGYDEDALTAYVVENIRRFKPKIAVGHDPLGEYGHGQHMVYSEVLQNAVQRTMDPGYFPDSAEKYGVWDVPKTYLHLYEENPIVMDWDQPLERFDGLTAFQVTKNLGFTCHVSQYWDFAWYMSGCDLATQVPKYSPCEYGLFRSTVGDDVQKNDFFENVLTYDQEARKAEQEEQARLEAERLAQEKAQQETEEPLPAQTLPQESEPEESKPAQSPQPQKTMLLVCVALAILAAIVLVLLLLMLLKKRY